MHARKIVGPKNARILLLACLLCSFPGSRAMKTQPPEGWEMLFDGKNLDKWRGVSSDSATSRGWEIKNGTCCVRDHAKGQDIITKDTYRDFELAFEFKLTFAANSGIKYLVEKIRNNKTGAMDWNGPEYQIIDDLNNPDLKAHPHEESTTASLYLVYAPLNKKLLPPGQWNSGRIIVKGNHIEHWLNGVKVMSCERGSADFRRRMAATKFNVYDHYGELPEGHIMLTDHDGDQTYFRKIRIRRLNG